MGFLDKAKQLAEQAQQKLDEAQKNFNQSGSPQAGEGGVRYDEHGRPIQDAPPAAEAPPPPADPAAPISEAPPAPASETEPEGAERQPEPPAPSGGQANAAPDPFKPLQQ
jgi:hypothetical protein